MRENLSIATGVRLTAQQAIKAAQLAAAAGVSRNRLFGLLVDHAEIRGSPEISVNVERQNKSGAPTYKGQSAAFEKSYN